MGNRKERLRDYASSQDDKATITIPVIFLILIELCTFPTGTRCAGPQGDLGDTFPGIPLRIPPALLHPNTSFCCARQLLSAAFAEIRLKAPTPSALLISSCFAPCRIHESGFGLLDIDFLKIP